MEDPTLEKPSDYYDRYSRQHYVLGEKAMNRMGKANVFISGMGGVGIEIAKNVALAGVRKLTIHDTQNTTYLDLSTQYYLSEDDIGKNRATVSFPKLSELNPYVQFSVDTRPFDESSDLEFLKEFTCVVLTQKSLEFQKKVNRFCRENKISFIVADNYGAFVWAFNDPGQEHEVFDKNGENPLQVFVEKIENGVETTVTSLENHMHGFEEGDYVKFEEVEGMTELNYSKENEFVHKVKRIISPYQFTIETDSTSFGKYTTGGIVSQVKVPEVMNFLSLEESIEQPNICFTDFAKFTSPPNLHIGMQALHAFIQKHNALPEPWNLEHANEVVELAKEINEKTKAKVDELDETLIKQLAFTAQGGIIGLTAFLGGMVAQEVIKNLSGKFTPLNQWLYLDAVEILPDHDSMEFDRTNYLPVGSRYDSQIILVGKEINEKIRNINTFMIGAGAIGCEMLKNFAMLGVSTGTLGKITVTDNDLIEKSNLNRQFLFREHDLQKPKSQAAAKAAKQMNKDMNIEAFLDKVCEESEDKFSDNFFQTLDVVVNALDNVQARLYVDGRCIANRKPLMESGTLGSKGHVQVILPYLTETYASQTDPPDESFPVCTVKSFPSAIEHTIQWARSKFDSLFNEKPAELQKFFENKKQYIESLKGSQGPRVSALKHLIKTLENRPKTFDDCIAFARIKFESYYSNLIKNLLHAFPLDTVLKDGTLFWKSPKRPPTPLVFDINEKLHYDFILSTALLYANVYGIKSDESQYNVKYISEVISNVIVPEFTPKNKKIETDPNAKPTEEVVDPNELEKLIEKLESIADKVEPFPVYPQEFEKDDDTNHHIDFITASSNLRAINYKINTVERMEAKRISGKIIPAIATTTAVVAGLVSIEIVKVVQNLPLEKYKSCFLNLALPVFQLSEPGPAQKTYINETAYFTVWDTWEVKEGDITIEEFIKYFRTTKNLVVTGIFQDVKSIYASLMPLHKTRLKKKLTSFLKADLKEQSYVDLIVSFENESGEEVNGPSVRFFWQ